MRFRYFMVAWQFLTILPINVHSKVDPADLGRSMAWYPLVGLFLGGILWLCWKGLIVVFPSPLVDLFLIALLIMLTGGIHLDGLADTVDGVWGSSSREEALRIMRDTQIGAFGVIALVLVIMAKYLTLNHLNSELKAQALLGMPVLGRWAMVLVAYRSVYARNEPGLARPFTEHLSWKEMLWAGLVTLAICSGILGLQGLFGLALVAISSYGIRGYLMKRLGGVTGDCIGATGELMEVVFLLSVLSWQQVLYADEV